MTNTANYVLEISLIILALLCSTNALPLLLAVAQPILEHYKPFPLPPLTCLSGYTQPFRVKSATFANIFAFTLLPPTFSYLFRKAHGVTQAKHV